jgi:hypothetical protein
MVCAELTPPETTGNVRPPIDTSRTPAAVLT